MSEKELSPIRCATAPNRTVCTIRKCVFLRAEEPGWSMDGRKACALIFANNAFNVFPFRDSRALKVPREALGNGKET